MGGVILNKRVARLLGGVSILLVVAVGCGSSADSSGENESQQRAAALQRAQQQAAQRRELRRQVARVRQARAPRQAARQRARRAEARRQRAAAAVAAEAATTAESSCDPNYSGACLDPSASDYDCEGGSGDGPYYTGTVTVVGADPHGLDSDGDGIGCE
jgi:hypothetical protein